MNRKKFLYYMVKLARQSGSPEVVARGVFIGLFIGLLIPFGMQIMIALPLAFAFRANKVTAVAFTLITNPWSIVFIYPFQCYIGSHIIANPLSYQRLKDIFGSFIKKISGSEMSMTDSYSELISLGMEIVVPFFVGGFILGITAALIGYFSSLSLVKRIRDRKEKRKSERRARLLSATPAMQQGKE